MEETENRAAVPTISGPYIPAHQTETSPLKQNLINKKDICFNFCWNWDFTNEYTGSLKTIIVILFGATGAITLALLGQIYYGEFQVEPHGSVSTDSFECSKIGLNVLKKGGNAVDAAIASTMCLGVVHFHVTGLGGGGYMMIYNHRKHKIVEVLDFREMVPNSYDKNPIDTSIGGLAVGVPGFLKGLWDAHQKYGRLSWRDIIVPSVVLARDGFAVSDSLINSKSHLNVRLGDNVELIKFLNSMEAGQNITIPGLYDTLQAISTKGIEEFYNGTIAGQIVYSVKNAHGNMTLEDISQYETVKSEAIKLAFEGFDVYATGGSSGGALLLNILGTIEILDLNLEQDSQEDIVVKLADVIQDTYHRYLAKIYDSPISFPDPAGSQVSVADGDEVYVSVVTGLNTWLGSQILTDSGFILNNAIINGGIDHRRRPLSFSSPVIAVQSEEVCGRRLILGTADVDICAQLLTELLVFNKNTSASVEAPRFISDLQPKHIKLEVHHQPTFSPEVIGNLGLNYSINIEGLLEPYKSINVIEKIGDIMASYADSRGGGASAQYK